ncbi:MAG TPA: aldo/keto reductase [Candidatus Saccharimonadales bacterium]|nr:aldo/keto reductase [Candidatus Saccharimonadales bacterium]
MSQPTITLNNGVVMPQIGLGVWNAKDGEEVASAVDAAIKAGYRLIDTAAVYGNEQGVGEGIRRSGIKREELFVTTKVWNSDQGFDSTLKAFDVSLKKLGLDYVDLYLIHWPAPELDKYLDTWKAMEQLHESGRVKAIGVCNFAIEHLERLMKESVILPTVNQVELHPYFQQVAMREFCKGNDIKVESWSPIGGPGGGGSRKNDVTPVLDNPVIKEIGSKYNKSAAQVVIRWHLQNDLIVIPKSVHEERIKENFDVFNFELSTEDIEQINALDTGIRGGADPMTMNSH